jgi:ADP-dependent NAD(P)H-hydrate dehydratase
VKAREPLDRTALKHHPLPPVVDGAKDTKGRLLVVAGSRDVPGAALLAARAGMRAGAGKLRIATVESAAVPLGIAMPEAMVVGMDEAADGGFASSSAQRIGDLAAEAEAVVAGPGVKGNESCRAITDVLLKRARGLALDVAFLDKLEPTSRESPLLLLPNADELAELLDCGEDEIADDPIGCGQRAAERHRALVLVKGVTSHVVTPDRQVWSYDGGAPGLGVSGSGDVLAGIVGGLLARGAEPLNALLWSVWLHGEAGAKLAKKVGPIGFLAREVADEIPALLSA